MHRAILLALAAAALSVSSLASAGYRLQPPDANGGQWAFAEAFHEDLSEAMQADVWARINANIRELGAGAQLPALKADPQVRFSWPTRFAPGRPGFLDHAVINYVDVDPTPGSLKDQACGARTYDGHNGTDIGLGTRVFYQQDTEQVVVIAAAPGVIILKDDTNPDRSCGNVTTNVPANIIAVRHADTTISMYYHVKQGSATAKKVGDSVAEGEYLASVGSAGISSEPHLHFEVRDAAGNVISPWVGTCNKTTSVTLWKNEEPYRVKEVMTVIPSTVAPGDNLSTKCVNNIAELTPASGYLQPDYYMQAGRTHYFTVQFRDVQVNDAIVMSLLRPNGTEYTRFPITGSGDGNALYVAGWSVPASEPAGQWSFVVTYAGKTYSTPISFRVAAPTAARVYEFYHAGLNHYFRTANAAEAAGLTPASGFLPTGDDYNALDRAATVAGSSPVCRFYGSVDPGPNSHFYTASPAECDGLKAIAATTPATLPRWNYEETAYAAFLPANSVCPANAEFPIYRLYNGHAGETVNGKREDSNHRFTTLFSEYYRMALTGWTGEGVVMCAQSKP